MCIRDSRKSDNDIIFPYSYTHFEQLEIPYMVNANSFLAPTITGIITRFHQARPDIKIDDLLEIVSKTVVCLLYTSNATFKAYYDAKRAEGRSHYNALGHCAGKLVRVIWKMLTDEVEFNLE